MWALDRPLHDLTSCLHPLPHARPRGPPSARGSPHARPSRPPRPAPRQVRFPGLPASHSPSNFCQALQTRPDRDPGSQLTRPGAPERVLAAAARASEPRPGEPWVAAMAGPARAAGPHVRRARGPRRAPPPLPGPRSRLSESLRRPRGGPRAGDGLSAAARGPRGSAAARGGEAAVSRAPGV